MKFNLQKLDKIFKKKETKEFSYSSFSKLNKFGNLLKKYDYDINKVIGVDKEKIDKNKYEEKVYILLADKKLIRIYRDNLKASPLLSGYIPVEDAIPLNFDVEKGIISKLKKDEIKEYIETLIYESGGLKEEEEYDIKFVLVEKEDDDNNYQVESVIVPKSSIKSRFGDLVERVGYIDYIAFPAFSYKSLYESKILKEAKDLFVVILDDKMFLTFYSNGILQKILTISGGLEQIYERLEEEVKIKNFDKHVFIKLLEKKGLNKTKYVRREKKVYDILHEEFVKLFKSINIEGMDIDRVFITTKYGNVDHLEVELNNETQKDVFNFQFYEEYNLDKLPIDPFLFLAMLEAHVAYKNGHQDFNFSYFLRPPTFFYRPSGQLVLVTVISFILSGAYPLYLYINGKMYENKNKLLQKNLTKLSVQLNELNARLSAMVKVGKSLRLKEQSLIKEIKNTNDLIDEIYKFKYDYFPVSETLFEITKLINKNNVVLENLEYRNGVYVLKVKSDFDFQIPNLIYDLNANAFKVYTDKIEKTNGIYTSIIRIEQ